ncbi:MAG: twin-arginine translocase subunit TatC [Actinomycetota bacterium]|nr:twin-arginine translocase subunit TatC [Actinomycetota bacterium]
MSRTDRSVAMPLTEHLRELRSRTVKSAIAVIIGMVIGWFFYPQLFAWISAPFNDVVAEAKEQGREITLALTGVADPFVLQLQVAAVAGLLLSAPVWLYQLWRFITPGLHKHERRWALGFVAVAFPLVLAGVFVAYSVLPIGLDLLFGFTPDGVANIVSVDRYLSFFLRMVLVFCVGFLAPLVLIALNMAGILTGKRLLGWWRWIIFIIFIFAAVATPTGDPINMSLLAGPILLLVTFAICFSLLNDKRRARKRARNGDFSDLGDDEISPLNLDDNDE